MIKVKIKNILKEATNMICPPATQDLKLNTINRDAAIQAKPSSMDHLMLKNPVTIGKK